MNYAEAGFVLNILAGNPASCDIRFNSAVARP